MLKLKKETISNLDHSKVMDADLLKIRGGTGDLCQTPGPTVPPTSLIYHRTKMGNCETKNPNLCG